MLGRKLFLLIATLSMIFTASGYEVSVEVLINGTEVENASVAVYNETGLIAQNLTSSGSAIFELDGGSYTIKAFYELCFNESFIELNENSSVTINLSCETVLIKVFDKVGNPIENASVKAGEVEKFTDEEGIATLNTTDLGFKVSVSKEGYVARSIYVDSEEIGVILFEDLITFYLGNNENYEALKEIENEKTLIEVFKLGDEVDFANKSLIFLANVNESVSNEIANATDATIVSFNSSAGYSDEMIAKYWIYGGKENLLNLVNYLRAKFFNLQISYDPPKVPENRAKILFILDKDLKQVQLILNASKDLYVEKNLEIKLLGYSNVEDLKEEIEKLDLNDFSVFFLYMLGYPAQDLLKDYLLPLKQKAKILGLGSTDVHSITNVNLSETEYSNITLYWNYGGSENFKGLMIFIGVKLCNIAVEEFGLTEIPNPIEIPPYGIYHPRAIGNGYGGMGIFLGFEEYMGWYRDNGFKENAPVVGIHYYYVNDPSTYPVIDELIFKLEDLGANVVFSSFTYRDQNSTKWLIEDGKARVDVLITLTSFRLWSHSGSEDVGLKYLQELNVTPIKAIMEYYYNVSEWESLHGLNPQSIAWQIALPELDGLTEFIIVGAKNKTTKDYDPIGEQIEWIAKRALKWAELHRKQNGEKKVVIIYYNHNGGKDNIGASYLDVPASLEVLLKAMKEKGYNLDTSFDKKLLTKLLMTQGINIGSWKKDELENLTKTAVLIPAEKYLQWFNELPENKRQEVIKYWGEPPGEVMVFENEGGKFIVIPLINLGNVILAPQPSRGWLENSTILYHDKSLPPHHQYIAFYFWIAKEFKADAIVHFGTHGTQEWLPGKESGLSTKDCWPALLIQDLPVVYPYIMDNVGEGTQAKRRGQAVIVDHLTPPLIESGLYGNLSLLHEKIHQYFEAQDEAVKAELRKTIEELYKELELEFLGNISELSKEEFENFLQTKLHEYLHELSSTVMPYGLHILGFVRNDEITLELVKAMLGKEFKEKVDKVRQINEPEDEQILNDLLREVLFNGSSLEEAQQKLLGGVNESISQELEKALKYYYDLMNCTIEIPRILQALEGKYIPPRIGGDPIRKPEALPTGNNFYSFDPRTIPTKEAWNVAVKLVDDLLRKYYEEKGEFPESIAYVLWATETMRNYGVMQAAVLYTMGVKIEWDSAGRVKDVSLIPLSDLKLRLSDGKEIQRPRIDVVVVSSGLHRDTFSSLMLLLDKAVKLCINANEDPSLNYVRKHYLEIKENLKSKGYSEEEADKLAKIRIFSESPGNYGTGLAEAVKASNTWQSDAKLAELFLSRVGFAYGQDFWGISAKDVFAGALKNVDLAVHSRSTNIFAALDNDDVFQYLGGIALAVRHLTGSDPETYIFDVRNVNDPKAITLKEFIASELLTRYFNPKWIEGVMENDYAGARLIAEIVENLWGWDVMMPSLISDKTWQNFYEIYVKDKYDLGLKEFFEKNNPYALQSIVARMLEAIRKDYWNAPEEVKVQLAKELDRLQKEYGFTCCHHTCGNIELLDFKAGILSSLIEQKETKEEKKEVVEQKPRYRSSGGGRVISTAQTVTPTTSQSGNQTAGVGFEQSIPKAEQKEQNEEIAGYKMEVAEKQLQSFEISATPLIAIIMVVLAVLIFYAGMKLRK